VGQVLVEPARRDRAEQPPELSDGGAANLGGQLSFEGGVETPGGGQGRATARTQTQAFDPAVFRIDLAFHIAPLDHLREDLGHSLIGDPQPSGQLPLARPLVGQGPEDVAVGAPQVVEALVGERGAQQGERASDHRATAAGASRANSPAQYGHRPPEDPGALPR
jgi:hypothetical protein